MSREIFLFIGPPGAGKGTLAHLCMNRMGWMQCSTGDLCRQHISQGTTLGKEIDLLVKSGKLIPDALIIDMVEQWLKEHMAQGTKVILDGFPRTMIQAQKLDALLEKPEFSDCAVSIVRMELDNETVVKRLVSRLICTNKDCCAVYSAHVGEVTTCAECGAPLMRRHDDIESVIRERLKAYHEHAQDLIHYYQKTGRRTGILNVAQPVEKVFDQFVHIMGLQAV